MTEEKNGFCDEFTYKKMLISDRRIPWSIRKEVLRDQLQNDDYRKFMTDYMRERGDIGF